MVSCHATAERGKRASCSSSVCSVTDAASLNVKQASGPSYLRKPALALSSTSGMTQRHCFPQRSDFHRHLWRMASCRQEVWSLNSCHHIAAPSVSRSWGRWADAELAAASAAAVLGERVASGSGLLLDTF